MAKIVITIQDAKDGSIELQISESRKSLNSSMKDLTAAEELGLDICDFIREQAEDIEEISDTTSEVH